MRMLSRIFCFVTKYFCRFFFTDKVFDVLPLYGSLRPTECQQFQFTFYGHKHIMAEATAVCSVEGGPDYEVHLKGEASVMEYKFNQKVIDFGKQVNFNFLFFYRGENSNDGEI